ncbi:MAG TPA: acetate--CoA ligase family protein, partial [Acidimicrobiia bacterium]|nr:acetate--CoA ligase family protein [Acidimicrobiia bacterium]
KAAGVLHKTDVGGVRLGLASAEAVAAAYDDMATRVAATRQVMTGAYVQAMTPPGVETIAGLVRDPAFGPLVMFGLGGIAAELVGDTALRVAPLSDRDAADLVRGLRSSPLLFGYRGSAPTDTDAIETILLRLSLLGLQVPEVAELDLNPVIAGPESATVVDWRIRLVPARRYPDHDLRRLR